MVLFFVPLICLLASDFKIKILFVPFILGFFALGWSLISLVTADPIETEIYPLMTTSCTDGSRIQYFVRKNGMIFNVTKHAGYYYPDSWQVAFHAKTKSCGLTWLSGRIEPFPKIPRKNIPLTELRSQ